MNKKIHDFNGFQIKLVGVVVIFSVGGGTHNITECDVCLAGRDFITCI